MWWEVLEVHPGEAQRGTEGVPAEAPAWREAGHSRCVLHLSLFGGWTEWTELGEESPEATQVSP